MSDLVQKTQVVVTNRSIPEEKTIDSRVSQGYILSPLLFLIYIHDFPSCLSQQKSFFLPITVKSQIKLSDDLQPTD